MGDGEKDDKEEKGGEKKKGKVGAGKSENKAPPLSSPSNDSFTPPRASLAIARLASFLIFSRMRSSPCPRLTRRKRIRWTCPVTWPIRLVESHQTTSNECDPNKRSIDRSINDAILLARQTIYCIGTTLVATKIHGPALLRCDHCPLDSHDRRGNRVRHFWQRLCSFCRDGLQRPPLRSGQRGGDQAIRLRC